jgi:hypothetical protein
MNPFLSVRLFRLAPGRIECDENGPRVGGAPLLTRDADGAWTTRDEGDVSRELSKLYGFPLDIGCKREGLGVIARALERRDLARAQIATLLLKLPDPRAAEGPAVGALQKRRLASDLAACGLLKAEDGWDEQHPRTGTSPNSGWFAAKPKADDPPNADTKPGEPPATSGDAHGGAAAFLPPAPAVGAATLLARDLAPTVSDALATLAARMSVPTLLFDAIFVPRANPLVDEGLVPSRPDMAYRWAHDETSVTFSALVDGEWRALTGGAQDGGAFLDENGEPVAVAVRGPDNRWTLVSSVDVLDRALADLKSGTGAPEAARASDDDEPKLCPDPTPEPKTTKSLNSIRYQEYVSKLRYGLAIRVGGVRFDGCDPTTGDLLEAKADIDFMFDDADQLNAFVRPENDPLLQMQRQVDAALAASPPRRVVWHAQTRKGFRGLSETAKGLTYGDLFVIYDPN